MLLIGIIFLLAFGCTIYYFCTAIQALASDLEKFKDYSVSIREDLSGLIKEFHFGPVPADPISFKYRVEDLQNKLMTQTQEINTIKERIHTTQLFVDEMQACLMTLTKVVMKDNPDVFPKEITKKKKQPKKKVKVVKRSKGKAVAYNEPIEEDVQ